MSTSTSGPGGVKNLRAMFENKTTDQSNSPPSRGRSPNGSVSSVQSRPLSKVRASFVAVERPGEIGQSSQWGLRKASDIESMDGLKEEAVVDGRNGSTHRGSSSSEFAGLGLILKGSPFETLPSTSSGQSAAPSKITPSNGQAKKNGLPKPSGKVENVASMVQKLQNGNKSESTKKEEVGATNVSKPSKTQSKIATKQQSPTATKSSPKIPVKTPTTPTLNTTTGPAVKPKGGVNKIKGVMESAEQAKQERNATASKEIKPPSVASKPTAASKERANIPTKGESLKDPEPARPAATRPSKLPSAAVQTTAAAAAKREQGPVADAAKGKSSERKATIPQAPKAATASTRASLARKSSRTSLAPVSEKPKARLSMASQATDESFLSRMTRPTTSSAQKAHEKVQTSAPSQPKRASLGGKEVPKKSSRKISNVHTKVVSEESADELQASPLAGEATQAVNGNSNNMIDAEQAVPQQQAEVEF